jgi:CheY-like chemotaxis protein
MAEDTSRGPATLVLLVDEDRSTRALLRPLLLPYGLEIIQARSSVAALEVLQRLADRFRAVIVSLEMSGLSGAVVLATVRLCLPAVATLCLSTTARAHAGADGACLAKPLQTAELRGRIARALDGRSAPGPGIELAPEVLARAQAAYALSASLLDAARELARGTPGGSEGW